MGRQCRVNMLSLENSARKFPFWAEGTYTHNAKFNGERIIIFKLHMSLFDLDSEKFTTPIPYMVLSTHNILYFLGMFALLKNKKYLNICPPLFSFFEYLLY